MTGPDGTRPWRKTWRKKWREESSYRSLTLLQREFLTWVESNADDSGRTPPTGEHFLARLFSSPTERISRDAVHRAAVALERVGLVARQPHSESHTEAHRPRTVYVRVNWDKYQDSPEEPAQPSAQGDEARPHRDSRGKQKNAEKQKGAADAAAPGWQELVAGLNARWTARYPEGTYVWQGRDFKALKALRAALPDDELLRRFGNYLASSDPFYAGHPVSVFCSQVNRFVAVAVAPSRDDKPRDVRFGAAPAEKHTHTGKVAL